MGFEAYLIQIKFKSILEKQSFWENIDLLSSIENKLKTDRYCYINYFCGIVELENQEDVSIMCRIAKPNLKESLKLFFQEMKEINKSIYFELYDCQSHKTVKSIDEILENFNKERKLFFELYPNISYPIKCKDVFKKIATEKGSKYN